jgi:hypothetical protein
MTGISGLAEVSAEQQYFYIVFRCSAGDHHYL